MANLSAIKLPNGTTYSLKDSGALQLTGGQVTGPVSFGDSVTMDEVTTGDLVVNGSASFTNNIQANTINGVEVGTNPKFTDTNTVTTVSTSGSGNAVTSITASNGALTVTKGTTFLTSHQDISGKADKSATVSTVAYDSTNQKITKTINGTTSDVVTVATLKTALGSMPASDVYSWAKASTKPTYTASEVGALASNTTYVSKITTTAGAHTAISNQSGAVSFNVPTKTSDLTNDSGFLTSHQTITKAMVTTALGTGSGTTKFLREDGSWAKPAYIANTDAKLQVAEVTSATQYYPLVGTGTTAATRQYDTTGFKYKGTTGTTSAVGSAIVELGNSTASGTAGNKQAQLIMYGSNAKKATITLAAPSADIALALPTSGGTLALTSQIPTVSYPVTSVNSKTGAVSLTASDVGAVPTTRTVNGKALSANVADADYVTEEGTSGVWKYRKWNSGKIEAWGTLDFTSASWSTWASPVKYMDKTYSIPSGIFSATPTTIAITSSNQYWVVGCAATSTTAGSIRFATVASSAMATRINIYAYED